MGACRPATSGSAWCELKVVAGFDNGNKRREAANGQPSGQTRELDRILPSPARILAVGAETDDHICTQAWGAGSAGARWPDIFLRKRNEASAGMTSIAPSMLKRNMKARRMPMSAWNFSMENAQVPTPSASAKPVKTTEVPIVAKAQQMEASSDLPSRIRSSMAEQR